MKSEMGCDSICAAPARRGKKPAALPFLRSPVSGRSWLLALTGSPQREREREALMRHRETCCIITQWIASRH